MLTDLPGHCRSGGAPASTVEQAADWVLALLDAAGVAKAALEADAVILIDKPAVIARAKQLGIDLFGFGPA